jgi:hypothetical protein
MGQFFNQIDRVVSRYLNSTDDPLPGQPLTSPSGSIVVGFDGMLGQKYAVTGLLAGSNPESTALSLTSTGTLYGGVYQYVQFKSGSTAANIRGGVLFWSDIANFVVTPDVTLATQGQIAGIGLFANTKGNYGYIQVAGLASILFKSSITKGTPAAGDLVIVDQGGGTPTARGDILADATSITSPILKSVLGVAFVDVPSNATVSRVLLTQTRWTN